MFSPEIILDAVPYLAIAASSALISSVVSLRFMRNAGTRAAARCAPSAAAMFAGRPPAVAVEIESEPEFTNQPPAALADVAARKRSRRLLRPEVAAREFIAFMREQKQTGWFAAEHIDEAWLWFCSQTNTIEIDPSDIRAQLAAIKACRHGYKRLNGPEFAAVRENIGRDRATVYYIPPAGVPLDAADAASSPDHRPATRREPMNAGAPPAPGRAPTGARPANGQKRPQNKGHGVAASSPASRHGFDFSPGADLVAA